MKTFYEIILLTAVPNTKALISAHLRNPSSRIYGNTITHEHDDDETIRSYKTVAQQDPEWYQRHVTEIVEDTEVLMSAKQDQNFDFELSNEKILPTPDEFVPSLLINDVQRAENSSICEMDNVLQSSHRSSNSTIDTYAFSRKMINVQPTSPFSRPIDSVHSGEPHFITGDIDGELGEDKCSNAGIENIVAPEGEHGNIKNLNMQTVNTNEIERSPLITYTEAPKSEKGRKYVKVIRAKSKNHQINKLKKEKGERNCIVYRDLFIDELLTINLLDLTNLGYDAEAILLMSSSVLSVIIEDKIKRPRRGIPKGWKLKLDRKLSMDYSPRMVSIKESRQILQNAADHQIRSYRIGEDRISASRMQYYMSRNYYPRELESRKLLMDRQAQRNDPPPPPSNSFWVDIDSFRDLLRFEAEWRIGILGKDWKYVVKHECKWRLALYKEWLWVLFFTKKHGCSIARASCCATMVLIFHYSCLVPAMALALIPGN